VLSEFLQLYPEIDLDLDFNDRIVDPIDEGVDVAIRSRKTPDNRIMMRALRPFQLLLCASPAYLKQQGVPTCQRDLSGHVRIGFRYPNNGNIQD
jgi:DNA-binding transcriptional LysR family regulator